MLSEELDKIGEGISDLTSLRLHDHIVGLNLHGNSLCTLGGLPRLQWLTELNLSSNNFHCCNFPELSFLPSLCTLDFSANFIGDISDLPFMPGLKTLSIAYNTLRSVEGIDENVPNLFCLDIRGNRIAEADDMFSLTLLRRLEELHVGGRKPNPVCSNIPAMCQLFKDCRTLQLLDDKSLDQWNAFLSCSTQVEEEVTMPCFEKVARVFRSRLLQQLQPSLSPENGGSVAKASTSAEPPSYAVEVETDVGTDLEDSFEDANASPTSHTIMLSHDYLHHATPLYDEEIVPQHSLQTNERGRCLERSELTNGVNIRVEGPELENLSFLRDTVTVSSSETAVAADSLVGHQNVDGHSRSSSSSSNSSSSRTNKNGSDGDSESTSTEDDDISSKSFSIEDEEQQPGNETHRFLEATAAVEALAAQSTLVNIGGFSMHSRRATGDPTGDRDDDLSKIVTLLRATAAVDDKRLRHERLAHYFYRMRSHVADLRVSASVVAVGTMVEEKSALEERCEQLEMILLSKESELKTLRDRDVSHNADYVRDKEKEREREQEREQLYEQRILQERQKAINNNRKAFHLQANLMALRKELQVAKDIERDQSKQLEAAAAANEALSEQLEKVREEAEQAQRDKEQTLTELYELQSKHNAFEEANLVLQREKGELELKSQAMTSELQKLLTLLQEMEVAENDLKTTLSSSDSDRTRLEAVNAELTALLRAEKEKTEELARQSAEYQLKTEKATRRMMASHNAFEKCSADNVALRDCIQELESAKEERDATIEELSECVQQLRTALKHVKTSLEHEKENSAQKDRELQNLQTFVNRSGGLVSADPQTSQGPVQTNSARGGNSCDGCDQLKRDFEQEDFDRCTQELKAKNAQLRQQRDELLQLVAQLEFRQSCESLALKNIFTMHSEAEKGLDGAHRAQGNDVITANGKDNEAGDETLRQSVAVSSISSLGTMVRKLGAKFDGFDDDLPDDIEHDDSNYLDKDEDSRNMPRLFPDVQDVSQRAQLLERELQKRLTQLVHAGKKITALEARSKDAEVALKVKDALLEDKVVVVNDLKGKLHISEKECEDLQVLLAQAESMIEHAREDIVDLERQLETRERDLAELTRVIDRLQGGDDGENQGGGEGDDGNEEVGEDEEEVEEAKDHSATDEHLLEEEAGYLRRGSYSHNSPPSRRYAQINDDDVDENGHGADEFEDGRRAGVADLTDTRNHNDNDFGGYPEGTDTVVDALPFTDKEDEEEVEEEQEQRQQSINGNNESTASDDIGEIALLLKDSRFGDDDRIGKDSSHPSTSPTRPPLSPATRSNLSVKPTTLDLGDGMFSPSTPSRANVQAGEKNSLVTTPRLSDADKILPGCVPTRPQEYSTSSPSRSPSKAAKQVLSMVAEIQNKPTKESVAIEAAKAAALIYAATAPLEHALSNLKAELESAKEKCEEECAAKESLQKLLSEKEVECVRIAQTLVLLEGKIEQLTFRLEIEQERNDMLVESIRVERKRLQKSSKQLQADLTQKEDELRRTKVAVEQLRMLVASGALNI